MSVLSEKEKKKLYDFTNGIDVDVHLCAQEIRVQKEWINSLEKINILKKNESEKLHTVLDEALEKMKNKTFVWVKEDEDIHMNLERFITEKLGDLGKIIHLGRSRNDLIATTLRLFVSDSLEEVEKLLSHVILSLCEKAEQTTEIIVAGTTHLQNAQPIRMGHIFASHGWAFLRDKKRVSNSKRDCLENLPLGSAALAGTNLNIDLESLATSLGFSAPSPNSYDSVGDRDFIVGALNSFSSIAIHLSRLSEDLIFWASTPVGLVKLPNNWSTGSSIMPNKRNPDVPELIRAKSAHIIAAQNNAHILMKGLPTSYDSDLHELKTVFLRSLKEVGTCLEVLIPFITELEIHEKRAHEMLLQGHLLATEIANHLTIRGVSFREAYQQTASLVELAGEQNISIEKLNPDHLIKLAPKLDPLWISKLNFDSAVESRNQTGGTSKFQVYNGIKKLRDQNLNSDPLI